MVFIDLSKLELPEGWEDVADALTEELADIEPGKRNSFIDSKKRKTWGDDRLLEALRKIAGNKCWYSDLPLEGSDVNIDHFRPKGRITEVESDFPYSKTGTQSDGYWWLAFNWENFRLSSMHANQRRVDEDTSGGKADFFPVSGQRADELTPIGSMTEDILPLDPCKLSDVALLWYDPDGKIGYNGWQSTNDENEIQRLKLTNWLYHLDKKEIVAARRSHIVDIQKDLRTANSHYVSWNPQGPNKNMTSKNSFDIEIARIKGKMENTYPYARAILCAVKTASAKYKWVDKYVFH